MKNFSARGLDDDKYCYKLIIIAVTSRHMDQLSASGFVVA